MKPIFLSQDFCSVGDLKKQAARLLRQLRENQRPIVITHHGKPAAVLLLPEDFDRMASHVHFVSAVKEGLADAAAGRVVSDEALESELDAALGGSEAL